MEEKSEAFYGNDSINENSLSGADSNTTINNGYGIPEEERKAMSQSTWIDNRGMYKVNDSVEWNKLYHLKWYREKRPRYRSSSRPHRNWEIPGGVEGFSESILKSYGIKKAPATTPAQGRSDDVDNLSYLRNKSFVKKAQMISDSDGSNNLEKKIVTSVKLSYLLDIPYQSEEVDDTGFTKYEQKIINQLKEEQEINPLCHPQPRGPTNFYRQYTKKKIEWDPPKSISDIRWPSTI